MHGLIALISALGLGVGAWSLVPVGRSRGGVAVGEHDSSVSVRIAHALRDVSPTARSELAPSVSDPIGIAGVVFSSSWITFARWCDQLVGGSGDSMVTRAGVAYGVDEYRLRRLLALTAGAAGGLSVGAIIAVVSTLSPVIAVVVGLIGAIAGLGVYDRSLRQRIKLREARLMEEFPSVLELLALALSAGDSLPGALRRISRRGNGDLATEWARVIRMVDVGAALGPTLQESAKSMGVSEIEALTDHLASALERGAPLAEVVRAHSSDSRLQRLRGIVDRAGKAEVAMLVPLVLLILPITVLFAVWPSLQALNLGL